MQSERDIKREPGAEREPAGFRPAHEVEQIVTTARLELYNRGESCGPKAVRERMDDGYAVRPLPSIRTISRILTRQGLSNARTGNYDEDPGRASPIHKADR